MTVVNCAVEGALDEVVARRILRHLGHECGPVYGGEGKHHLRRRISGYAHGAAHGAWLVLVDLDNDYPCAPGLVAEWLPEPPPLMRFRVAVREVEAWLLGDRVGIATFLSVSRDLIPRSVDDLPDPKAVLIAAALRSRARAIRDGIPPRPGSGRTIGALYVSELSRFINERWDVDEASTASASLRRCLDALASL